MAVLTAKSRAKLPKSAFAVPGTRDYPMQDKGHAIAAVARAKQHGGPVKKIVNRACNRFGVACDQASGQDDAVLGTTSGKKFGHAGVGR
jgi:hypothetical protein